MNDIDNIPLTSLHRIHNHPFSPQFTSSQMHSSDSSSNMNLRNQSVWLLAGVALAGLALTPTSRAAQMTYEMRAVETGILAGDVTTAGVVISNGGHTVVPTGPNNVIVLQLFAVIQNLDGNHANDGFLTTFGSFLGTGDLPGGLRGDAVGSPVSQKNNIPGITFGSQSGYIGDLNGDVSLDVGNITNTGGSPIPAPWFIAVGGSGAPGTVFGTGAGTGNTEILIGEITFTLDGAANPLNQGTRINFKPRQWASGAGRNYAKFTTDGTSFQYNYDNVNLAVGADVIIGVPEPSAIGMLLLGSLGLVGFRRSAFRRLSA